MHAPNLGGFRSWLWPIVGLTALSLCLFWVLYAGDYYFEFGAKHTGLLAHYLRFDPASITDAVGALAGMIAAVFGIVITVVSIVVQLSAARYTGVTRMFLRDRINLTVMGYYVVSCVCGIWFSVSLHRDFVARGALICMLSLTTLGLVLMAPYFRYVFWFLEPENIVARIQREAINAAESGVNASATSARAQAQSHMLNLLEELTDIANSAISGKDKIIASSAVNALKDLALAYLPHKARANAHWFSLSESIEKNPVFVAMDAESLQDLQKRKTWVEWKIMRQFLGIYTEALSAMRDINYLIAIDTRYIGERALKTADSELSELVYRFMNSYLRAALNARDVRTAYNVLNQYRKLIEATISAKNVALASEGIQRMTYYAHTAYAARLPFVTETIAYDLSALCQFAHEAQSPAEDISLRELLEIDRPLRRPSEEGMLGVRKAQVKLAAFYLAQGDAQRAAQIARDVSAEPPARLEQIYRQLGAVTNKDFWEIIDRGRNFEYMPEREREKLDEFFASIGALLPS